MGLSFLGPFLAPSVFPEEDPGVAEKYFSEKIIPSELKTASKDLQQDLGGWSPFQMFYCIQVHCHKAVHCHVLCIVHVFSTYLHALVFTDFDFILVKCRV